MGSHRTESRSHARSCPVPAGPKMVAVQNYHGIPAPPGKPVLTFQTGDVIELLRGDPESQWWEVRPGPGRVKVLGCSRPRHGGSGESRQGWVWGIRRQGGEKGVSAGPGTWGWWRKDSGPSQEGPSLPVPPPPRGPDPSPSAAPWVASCAPSPSSPARPRPPCTHPAQARPAPPSPALEGTPRLRPTPVLPSPREQRRTRVHVTVYGSEP